MAILQSFKTNNNLSSKQTLCGLISEKTDAFLAAKSSAIAFIAESSNPNSDAKKGDLLRQWHIATPPIIYIPSDILPTVGQVLPR
jgi:hypothetical protein